jgi:sulfide:quinone oxidoreductase
LFVSFNVNLSNKSCIWQLRNFKVKYSPYTPSLQVQRVLAKHILILGGGAGGLILLEALQRKLRPGEAEITVVDRSDKHVFLAGLPWVATGYRDLDDLTAPLSLLERKGVKFVQAEVTKIDPANRAVETSKGKLEYDYLVVSLGAEPDFKAITGLEESIPPWTPDRALKLREALRSAGDGAVIVTGFVSPPFLCPPAPYEVAGQIATAAQAWGRRFKVKTVVPDRKPLIAMGPAIADSILEIYDRLGIEFIGGVRYDHIDPKSKEIVTSDGDRIKYDILAVTPPFKPARVVAQSPLAGKDGWMEVDPLRGFRSKKYDDVFGIGDIVAPPLGLPMAGVVAHAASDAIATAIASEVRGISMTLGLKIYAACAMDFGATGLLPFCDYTPVIFGKGPVYCARIMEGTIAKVAKELFEVYWFTKVIPKWSPHKP